MESNTEQYLVNLAPKSHGALCKIGTKHGTDKTNHDRTDGLCYLDIYESYFKNFKDKEVNILEIGVRTGNSVFTWKEYFSKANIFGVDIDTSCKQFEGERIKIVIGDATDVKTINEINPSEIKYDIIIDDGSHINLDIITSFNLLWDKLSDGGLYIIEDLHNSYGVDRDILGDAAGTPANKREDISIFFDSLIREVDTPFKNKLSIHFWRHICIIIKSS